VNGSSHSNTRAEEAKILNGGLQSHLNAFYGGDFSQAIFTSLWQQTQMVPWIKPFNTAHNFLEPYSQGKGVVVDLPNGETIQWELQMEMALKTDNE